MLINVKINKIRNGTLSRPNSINNLLKSCPTDLLKIISSELYKKVADKFLSVDMSN
jgi:hypothetical protein